jgi:hypothetical protein
MVIKGNKGEWSELYAFLRILSDKVLYSADENLILIPHSFIKILSVARATNNALLYSIDREHDQILVKQEDHVLTAVPVINISSKLANILQKIQRGTDSKGAFEVVEAKTLMQQLHADKLKSGSLKKADIYLQIDDPITGTHPTKGFSIKSRIGGMSTLFNASLATNFEFKIVSNTAEKRIKKPLIGLANILSDQETLEFVRVSNSNFAKNLIMIDSLMSQILAETVKAYYLGYGKDIQELTEHVKKNDPLNRGDHQYFYEYKIQQLLRAVAFGMQPTKLWSGNYEAHGGYIIVKENGELACYHTYDRDSFGKFLFFNTRLETPSLTRHKFGEVYEDSGARFIKLNLQIRFKC